MKRPLVGLAALAMVPLLAGCFNGQQATTQMQATMNSGNGVTASAGDVKIDNATLVLGPEGSNTATLTARLTNLGTAGDSLVHAAVNGVPATITGDSIEIGPQSAVSLAFDSDHFVNAYDFDATVSTYVPVELGFANSGLATMNVLIVPPVGYYSGIAPSPATAPSAAS